MDGLRPSIGGSKLGLPAGFSRTQGLTLFASHDAHEEACFANFSKNHVSPNSTYQKSYFPPKKIPVFPKSLFQNQIFPRFTILQYLYIPILQYLNNTILQYLNITISQYYNISISQYLNITISQY